ncbi:hypothetical protein LOZ53_004040 [Ophidiomyces ophidiicola]|nr:hypothetical protein LOZ53_004040 [Ophidiomyces ophidiicola]KAI1988720.1 hypothetical protein LOZ54_003126 [Ophidiomyces ophidiicola]KAI1999127.1 hypothetical protein LOZ51_001613 [Ophidiomyces ophidiicola]
MPSKNKRSASESPPPNDDHMDDWESLFNLEGAQQESEEFSSIPPLEEEEKQKQRTSSKKAPATSGNTNTSSTKKVRRGKNSPEPNYSALVQGQMAGTNRTGQACDRCKARKMKCDSNPTGCANCSASNSNCTQTDPISRVSSIRGELERVREENQNLRRENQLLRQENARLRQALTGAMPQRPPQGQFGMPNSTGYSSMQGLGPYLSGQNVPSQNLTRNPYQSQRPSSLPRRGNDRARLGNWPQQALNAQPFPAPLPQDPFMNNSTPMYANGNPFESGSPSMRRTVSQGYSSNTNARNHLPFQNTAQNAPYMGLPSQTQPASSRASNRPRQEAEKMPTKESSPFDEDKSP